MSEYSDKKKQVVKEVKAENEAAEIRDLNKQLEESGSDYVITEKVHWNPGDPVTNTGEAMLQADWEQELQERAPDLHHHWTRDPKGFWEAYDENLMEKYGMTRDEL